MKNRPILYRVFDETRKQMGYVISLHLAPNGVPREVLAKFKDEDDEDIDEVVDHSFSLMESVGITDLNDVMLYEGDIVSFIFDHPTGWQKLNGRVIWNPHLSYGDYGFVILDEHSGIHPFKNLDQIKVIGNTYEGIKK